MEISHASKINLTVFIAACIHWFVSAACCIKKRTYDNFLTDILKDSKEFGKKILQKKLSIKSFRPKNYWCISLVVMTLIVILSGIVQFSYFHEEDDN